MTGTKEIQKHGLNDKAAELFDRHARRIYSRCDRMFAGLMLLQWGLSIACALTITPRTWIGATPSLHVHVWASIFLGGAIAAVPVYFSRVAPGAALTRHTAAAAQMLYSALLIHLTGGRIETHFHIFGSLALLAFYRDWRVLLTGTAVTAADHFLRGIFWSESVFGVVFSSHWRWMEHAGWVVFEDLFLVTACVQARYEMAEIARRQAEVDSAFDMAKSDLDDLMSVLNAETLVGMTDSAARLTYVNDEYCRLSGYSREELLGKTQRTFRSDEQPESVWDQLYEVTRAGGLWTGEVARRSKDGRTYWVQSVCKGILGPDGTHRRTVTVQHDITARKTAEMHLQQSQRLESIGQLAAGIAHEINTPTQYIGDNVRFLKDEFEKLLQLIESYSHALDAESDPQPWAGRKARIEQQRSDLDFDFLREEIPKAIGQSLEGIVRVSTIIRAMKDFSHPGSDLKEPSDLNRSIASTIEVCRSRWKYVADLETDFDPDLPAVPCLVAEINQVVLNLIVNAADAICESIGTDSNLKGVIHVSTRVVDGSAEIRVRDNGPGIPEKIKRRMFEQFFTTKPVGKGTGQGLALSRNVVVAKHGGELFFESAEGAGTVFVVRLPLMEKADSGRKAA